MSMTVREIVAQLIMSEDMDATVRIRGKLGATLEVASVDTEVEGNDVIIDVGDD